MFIAAIDTPPGAPDASAAAAAALAQLEQTRDQQPAARPAYAPVSLSDFVAAMTLAWQQTTPLQGIRERTLR